MSEQTSKIEETLSHQEQQIQDLSDVLIQQSHEISALKKQVAKLQAKIDTVQDEIGSGGDQDLSVSEMAARDKPPHY